MKIGETNDLEILNRSILGDSVAVGELYKRYFSLVRRFFMSKFLSAEVDDLTQQTFEILFRSLERFRGEGSLRQYIIGIARHVLLRSLREKSRRADYDCDPDELEILAGCSTSHEEHVQNRMQVDVLIAALSSLPLLSQRILELYYFEERSASQCAETLGIPEGTVRGRLRLAKHALRRALKLDEHSTQEYSTERERAKVRNS